MNYFLLIVNLILIIEFLKRFNYFTYIDFLVKLCKKSIKIISKKNISDHWKEKSIPQYSFLMIKCSLKMLIVFCLSFSPIIISGLIFNDFLKLLFSLNGIIASSFFGFIYIYFCKIIRK